MEGIAVRIVFAAAHGGSAADGVGGNGVVLVLVNGGDLLSLVLEEYFVPVGDGVVEAGDLVDEVCVAAFGLHGEVVDGPVLVLWRNGAPVDLSAAGVGDGLGSGAVAGEQERVALLEELWDEVVADVGVGVGECGGKVGAGFKFTADDEVVAIPCRVNALANSL